MNKQRELKCWKIKGCPSEFYLECPAWALDKNCWEVPGTRCKESHLNNECIKCEVYRIHKQDIKNKSNPKTAE
jgi:hypothetical protein